MYKFLSMYRTAIKRMIVFFNLQFYLQNIYNIFCYVQILSMYWTLIKDLHHTFIGISVILLVYQLQGVIYILKCSVGSI